MDVESGFQEDVISQTNDVGLMQINVINHKEMNELFGITDMLDAENNIIAGVYMLSVLYNKYEHDNLVLMAYNLGESKAKSYWERGTYETEYVEKVVNKIGTYGTTERVS
jgi:soluble lytic murein transglycosylase-like protein